MMSNSAALVRMEMCSQEIAEKGLATKYRKEIYEEMTALYKTYECIRQVWDWVEEATRYALKFVKKCGWCLVNAIHPNVDWNGIASYRVAKGKKVEQFYLIRLLDKDGDLVYSKCGTTTVSTIERMKQHLKYYYDYGVRKVEVSRLWNCGNIPAEGLESHFRALYIQRYPESFKKNDRFINVEFDLNEADKIVEEYLNKSH